MKLETDPRQLAVTILRDIYRKDAYTDIALDQGLKQAQLKSLDRGLVTELVYGIVRRVRTLDQLITQLGKKTATQQPPDLRIILQIGLYQLRYLDQIPVSAAVNTSVELAKKNQLGKLSGVVNGILRQYDRIQAQGKDPLELPSDRINRLGVLHSFPNWIVQQWLEEWGEGETEKLCEWFNQPAMIDIRVNLLKTTVEEVELGFSKAGVKVLPVPHLPQALRLIGGSRSISQLPGFEEGWWTVQDSSAQLVTHLLDPQPEEIIIDACAAPGGKTTHIAELMQDRGTIWACDRVASRLRKVQQNAQRLQLNSIKICSGDSRQLTQFRETADRVLIDAPCSGLGTLHKRPDIRWRQTPEKIEELSVLQRELLEEAASWIKPKGVLVYATCTLNPLENEKLIEAFLHHHPNWQIQPPLSSSPAAAFATTPGWIKVLPHLHLMDGFFMVKLVKGF
ncbi:16S rRNA (cytosine(967)-C(5))-methyltransferase [Gloeothece verrucosa]|uniref:16S rRNA (cytosine(967)-C(5))-methyltransferase n=1 Tax=Gloeothece verrucosa (strain PCC 7822) TaxID=497965 RepID=E0UIJ5_GLOV7|nr:16S rRNA (cytosine(967)-C(5))-methyltransferase [Gloeothece verrucosa]ADN12189.1 sun protein [Gloeothece verrucosa PCC 7822]